jgi:hypothetical protein
MDDRIDEMDLLPISHDYGKRLSEYAILWYGETTRTTSLSPQVREEEEDVIPAEGDICILYSPLYEM